MRMKCRFVASLLLGSLTILTSCSNNNNTTTNSGPSGTGFLWVAAQGNSTVSAYTLDLTNGEPTQNGNAINGAIAPSAMIISPDGKTMFVADKAMDPNGNYDILTYTVNSNGTLTAGSSTPLTDAISPSGLAIDPSGKILFVANQGSALPPPPPSGPAPSCTMPAYAAQCGNISVFTVNGTTLTELAGSPFSDLDPNNPVVTGPTSLTVTPTGNFLYVTNQFTNTVSAFQYDPTGVLTPLSPFTYLTGGNPTGVALSRSIIVNNQITQPHYLYVVSVNCLTPTGQLTEIAGSPFGAGNGPVYIAVNPVYNGFYVVDQGSNEISMYKWSSTTGALITLSPPTVSAGASPTWAQVHPDGVWVYVANNGGTSISIYSVGTAGPLLGPITAGPFPVQPNPTALVLR
jgi:6-phosphogluconolactonase